MARDYNPVNICCVLDSNLAACLNFVFLRLQQVPNTLPCLSSSKWAKGRMLEWQGPWNAPDFELAEEKASISVGTSSRGWQKYHKFLFLSLSPSFFFSRAHFTAAENYSSFSDLCFNRQRGQGWQGNTFLGNVVTPNSPPKSTHRASSQQQLFWVPAGTDEEIVSRGALGRSGLRVPPQTNKYCYKR